MNARHLWFYGVMGAMTASCGVRAVVAGVRGRVAEIERQQRRWAQALLSAAKVDVEVRGAEHIRPGRPCVIVSNHASSLDPLVLFLGMPMGFTYVAKRELLKVPIFGWIIRRTGAVFVDRGDNAAARASLKVAADRMRAGQHVLVFPEGTRSPDGRLQPFKKGGFVLAIDAGADLLPVSIVGASALCPRDHWFIRPGKVVLCIHPPISTQGRTYEDREALMAAVHGAIDAGLGETREPDARADRAA
ncbi:MAG: lysophospholipid acyltransferase family protein [Myxococcota bacterium]